MPRRMNLQMAAYVLSGIALVVYLLYIPFEIYDAWQDADQRKVALKAMGLALCVATLTFMLLNPPE